MLVRTERGCRANDESQTQDESVASRSRCYAGVCGQVDPHNHHGRLCWRAVMSSVQLLRAFSLFLQGEALILFQAHEIDQ